MSWFKPKPQDLNTSIIKIHQGKPRGRYIPVRISITGLGGREMFSETVMVPKEKEIVVLCTKED